MIDGNKERGAPRVSVVRCGSYDTDAVMTAVRKAVDSLGGTAAFVSEGERILLKPNMLIPRRPDEAVTTHPEVLRAAIRLVKEENAVPVVGDSPAGRSTERILRHLADKTGIAQICEEEGAEFLFFTEGDKTAFPEGKMVKSFELTTALRGVDGVISLAKLKTHSFTRFTGGVKNLFGLVHGLRKAEYHMRMKDVEAFSDMLVDLAECVRPRITIMDAIVGMDGDGPSAGRPKQIGLILASSNPHALDAAALDIVGEAPESVPTVRIAIERHLLASTNVERYHAVGDLAPDARVDRFKMPPKTRIYGGVPNALRTFASEGISRKPVFRRAKCIGCRACEEICPGQALKVNAEEKDVAIDREKCFRCYCCHEVCPQKAVSLKRMPLRSWSRALLTALKRGP